MFCAYLDTWHTPVEVHQFPSNFGSAITKWYAVTNTNMKTPRALAKKPKS
uniref:Uncharacterized protein n=1 Tax=Arundo donax TaxID=35708 RepID=A0A0A8ZWU8_ARUDO